MGQMELGNQLSRLSYKRTTNVERTKSCNSLNILIMFFKQMKNFFEYFYFYIRISKSSSKRIDCQKHADVFMISSKHGT